MLPDVGYVVSPNPLLASYRMRVALVAPYTGLDYRIGAFGKTSFFYKHDEAMLPLAQEAKKLGACVVYDVVNDHFAGRNGDVYRAMCAEANRLTCASDWMADRILDVTGRESTVIPDPYETDECDPECYGRDVLWFGHSANISSVADAIPAVIAAKANPVICSNISSEQVVLWSRDAQRRLLDECAVVLLTGTNPGASSNRVLTALRAGRFVVAQDVPAWRELDEFIWIGDYREGIEWALNNRQAAVEKVRAGQDYIRERFSPQAIGKLWNPVLSA